jgi:O-acetyl-ADP-ribose deacetylase (regulator of RNase III)
MLSIILCDRQPGLVSAWRSCFSGRPEVSIEQGDLLDVEADAYVSPANSFGFMDGGIDADLSARFPGVQYRVQSAIAGLGGLLPVGEAIIVETEDPFVPYLVSAPTMQVPQAVAHTNNAFRAMLAILRCVEEFNRSGGEIESVAIPGLCTGVGAMPAQDAALQMARAYEEWLSDAATCR